jgi:hypothetical protein
VPNGNQNGNQKRQPERQLEAATRSGKKQENTVNSKQ